MFSLFSWGSCDVGEKEAEGNKIDSYIPYKINVPGDIKKIACGFNHTLFFLKNGKVFGYGKNEHGKLGSLDCALVPEQMNIFDNYVLNDISTGQDHSGAITDNGKLLMWGRNDYYELGRDSVNDNSLKFVPDLLYVKIVQVSCGTDHTLALSASSKIYSWGHNDCGQLGIGNNQCIKVHNAQNIEALFLIPVKQIRAGEKFSMVLTPSGSLYSFGLNNYGQLGRESAYTYCSVPLLVKHLRKQPIAYVSVGQSHVAALSMNGGVFTWGYGRYGQLGHNNYENRSTPSKVMDLMGSYVTQVECGMNHTLAFVVDTGLVYAFGEGDKGQLGISEKLEKTHTPRPIKGPWIPYKQTNPNRISRQLTLGDTPPHFIYQIYAGGNQSFMLAYDHTMLNKDYLDISPIDLIHWNWDHQSNIATINSQRNNDLSNIENVIQSIDNILSTFFSSLPCMASSFLIERENPPHISISYHGLDVDLVYEVMTKYFEKKTKVDLENIARFVQINVLSAISTNVNYPNLECLRFFLFLPISSLFNYTVCSEILLIPFTEAFITIPATLMKVIESWIGALKPRYFKKMIMISMNYLNKWVEERNPKTTKQNTRELSRSKSVLDFLKIMHKINEDNHRIIHYNSFYIPNILSVFDLYTSYLDWLQDRKGSNCITQFSIFNYPFLFDGISKAEVLKIETRMVQGGCGLNMPFSILPDGGSFHITVRRDNILGDTLTQLQNANQICLRKPFRVNFYGEDAHDEGGVMKELFLLIVPEILNPVYGLFIEDPESRLIWFNTMIFEDSLGHFNSIGRLFGLATFNNVIINLQFPLVLFKKLLNEKPNLEDLIELKPTVGRSLQQILDYEESDFEDVFLLDFVINLEVYGESQQIELVPDGKNKKVTLENRNEYVDKYIDYLLNKNVEQSFNKFCEGFMFTMQSNFIKFVKPIELQEIMVGTEIWDISELRTTCTYLGEYWDKHPVIEMFWNVLISFSHDQKKLFLRFLTGSDRIPVQGMSKINIKIQPLNCGEQFIPVAHTCFNLLDLPKYSSEDILRKKLTKSIENPEGFQLV